MTQSTDGRSWEPLSPAVVEWGNVPQNDFEWGGCERIGGKFYLLGGNWQDPGLWSGLSRAVRRSGL